LLGKIESLSFFGKIKIKILHPSDTSILSRSAMDSISTITRSAELKGHNHKEKRHYVKWPQILLIRTDFMDDKNKTFFSSTVGVGKIAGVWERNPQSLAIFSKK